MYNEVDGDLIVLAKQGKFDVIAQGNNCFCVQGAGLAPQFVKAFGSDKFPLESQEYKGDINKLGTIDYQTGKVVNGKFEWAKSNNFFDESLTVVNCYSQYGFGANHTEGSVAPLDYDALRLCLRKINHIFKGKTIGLPRIGCHLAGGIWNKSEATGYVEENQEFVQDIIREELIDMTVIIVNYKP